MQKHPALFGLSGSSSPRAFVPARVARRLAGFSLATAGLAMAASACSGGSTNGSGTRVTGQTSFASAPPYGAAGPNSFGGASAGNAGGSSGGGGASTPTAGGSQDSASSTPTRSVEETDLYRVEGNRLYYLNSYRGLMVFDVTQVDQPKLLGRAPIFGTPVQMFVENGIAVVVVADWYGTLDDGSPFHGSIVREFDATDPAHIQVVGDAKLGGWIQDTRIVGDNVLYAVSEDYGWTYGWAPNAGTSSTTGPTVIVSSVRFAGGPVKQITSKSYPGYGGVFNVTPNSIMLAHPLATDPNVYLPSSQTVLQYLDIIDPGGAIVERGSLVVDGSVQGWGADNGRWNLDFADGTTAHVVGCAYGNCGGSYVLATADFSDPDHPALDSELAIPATGWSATARFDGTGANARMYLSPAGAYSYYPGSGSPTTPLQVFDLSNPTAPAMAGQVQIPGSVWLMIPSGDQLFALGQDSSTYTSSQVSLKYLDVTNAASPRLIGASAFGDGWAWTPAASTFKAFTLDQTDGLVVLPFSGWSGTQYNNGVQLIEFTPPNAASPGSLGLGGAALTRGWVERGIIANGRILSLSDMALSVVDYSNPGLPKVTAQLTLARNVIAVQPGGSTVAEISSDWWGNDVSSSEVRVLPVTDPDEKTDESQAPSLSVPGVGARVFTNPTNGSLSYVVTSTQVPAPCPPSYYGPQATGCTSWQEQVEVVDTSNGAAVARGTVKLPIDPLYYYYGGDWGGFYYYDWYGGGDIVQVGADALAFRRWHPNYNPQGGYVDASSDLFVVDLSKPDAPAYSSLVVTDDPYGWWGNMRVVGNTLYTTHYVWPREPVANPSVRYYLDAIDLSDRQHPVIGKSVNVPGVLVGGSQTDPSILYMVDYRWNGDVNGGPINDFDVVKIDGGLAYLQSTTQLDGWVGNVIVQGDTAYTTTQRYVYDSTTSGVELHQIDLRNPAQPIDRVTSDPSWWGWLVDVQGDRMLVTSGWGPYYSPPGLDIYRVSPDAAPVYDQFVRTLGWWVNSAARQDNQLFLSSGYWGVQTVDLN